MNIEFSSLIPGLIALAIVVDVCIMAYVGKPIPDLIKEFSFMIFGFYFGRGSRPSNGQADKRS